ncbi:hypothetical protein AB0L06_42540 [Spirillospora sp. NPDC052269]
MPEGTEVIAEDMTGHNGGVFKGVKKASSLTGTGKMLREGTSESVRF